MAGANGTRDDDGAEWAGAPRTPARHTAGGGRPAAAIRGNGARTLEGTVAAASERGLRLEGRDGRLDSSKWAGEIAGPRRGQVVALRLDGSGFVRAVAPAEGAATGPHQMPTAGARNGHRPPGVPQACAASCAARPDLESADLFAPAGRWEAWVLR